MASNKDNDTEFDYAEEFFTNPPAEKNESNDAKANDEETSAEKKARENNESAKQNKSNDVFESPGENQISTDGMTSANEIPAKNVKPNADTGLEKENPTVENNAEVETENPTGENKSEVEPEKPTGEKNAEVETENHTGENKSEKLTGENKAEVETENHSNDGEVEEWDELQLDPKNTPDNPENTTSPIQFKEALQFFENIDLNDYADKIRPAPKRSAISSVFHNIVGPPKLHKSLVSERNLVFTLALIPFQNDEPVHVRILQTLYKSLSNRKFDCPRFGPHWELIGFQGNDPSTDLRGCGMLGLVTTLYFVTSPKTKTLASKIYQLSRDEVQNFPFCVMAINITRISLQVLRSGKVNKQCNQRLKQIQKQKSQQKYSSSIDLTVYEVFQELYESIFYKLYTVWKNEGKTMTESGFVVRDIETIAKQKPLELLKNYKKRHSTNSDGGGGRKGSVDKQDANDERIESFVGIEDL